MGLLELVLIVLLIAALLGREPLALGTVFDFVIALIVIAIIWRLLVVTGLV